MIKKSLLLIALLAISQPICFAERENSLYMPYNSFTSIETQQNNTNLINFDKLNKKDKIEKANNEIDQSSNEKLKLDTRQIIHQQALDYTTKHNGALPVL